MKNVMQYHFYKQIITNKNIEKVMCFCISMRTSELRSCNDIIVGCHVRVPCPVVFHPRVERGCTGGLWS